MNLMEGLMVTVTSEVLFRKKILLLNLTFLVLSLPFVLSKPDMVFNPMIL